MSQGNIGLPDADIFWIIHIYIYIYIYIYLLGTVKFDVHTAAV